MVGQSTSDDKEIDRIVSEADDKAALVAIVKAKLNPGEHIVWSGQPQVEAEAVRCVNPIVVPFGFTLSILLLYLGCRGSHTILAQAFASPMVNLILVLCGVLMLIITLGAFTKPEVARKHAAHTLYAVTNQQLLLLLSDGPEQNGNWQWRFMCFGSNDLLPSSEEVEQLDKRTGTVDLQVTATRSLRSLTGMDSQSARNAILVLQRNNCAPSESSS